MKKITYLFSDIRGFMMQVERNFPEFEEDKNASFPPVAISGALVPGWQTDEESDLMLIPDDSSIITDPLGNLGEHLVFAQPVQPEEVAGSYAKDVRGTCQRCNDMLVASGIADEAMVGVELEFNLFKGIRFNTSIDKNFVELQEADGWPNNSNEFSSGYRIGHRSMHFLPRPHDQYAHVRDQICFVFKNAGLAPLHHGHEAGLSQQEIATAPRSLVSAADGVQLQKHIIRNIAVQNGLTATFMPRPIPYTECNGMHVNVSLWRKGRNIFYKEGGVKGELSEQGLNFIAGVLRHLKALNAVTNPTVNSYKRLNYFYSQMRPAGWGYRNRTSAIRIPHFTGEADCRIEIRFPDALANPYLAFSGLICAGVDGIEHGFRPPPEERGSPKWYEQPFNAVAAAENAMASDLRCALIALEKDKEFLTRSRVFDDSLLSSVVQDGSFFWHWAATTPAPLEYQVFFGH